MYTVINAEGVIHNCHTQERYEKFKASGWKDHVADKDKKTKTTSAKGKS